MRSVGPPGCLVAEWRGGPKVLLMIASASPNYTGVKQGGIKTEPVCLYGDVTVMSTENHVVAARLFGNTHTLTAPSPAQQWVSFSQEKKKKKRDKEVIKRIMRAAARVKIIWKIIIIVILTVLHLFYNYHFLCLYSFKTYNQNKYDATFRALMKTTYEELIRNKRIKNKWAKRGVHYLVIKCVSIL